MEVPARVAAAAISAVEAHDVVVLVFDPDAPKEPALAGFFLGRDVEYQAAHFTEKFAPHIVKLVVLFVESIRVDENHLQETVRKELHRERKEISHRPEDFLALALAVVQG